MKTFYECYVSNYYQFCLKAVLICYVGFKKYFKERKSCGKKMLRKLQIIFCDFLYYNVIKLPVDEYKLISFWITQNLDTFTKKLFFQISLKLRKLDVVMSRKTNCRGKRKLRKLWISLVTIDSHIFFPLKYSRVQNLFGTV